jgi:hypothetical protein
VRSRQGVKTVAERLIAWIEGDYKEKTSKIKERSNARGMHKTDDEGPCGMQCSMCSASRCRMRCSCIAFAPRRCLVFSCFHAALSYPVDSSKVCLDKPRTTSCRALERRNVFVSSVSRTFVVVRAHGTPTPVSFSHDEPLVQSTQWPPVESLAFLLVCPFPSPLSPSLFNSHPRPTTVPTKKVLE